MGLELGGGGVDSSSVTVARIETPLYKTALRSAVGTTTVYTVPAGKTLFIATLYLMADSDIGGNSDAIGTLTWTDAVGGTFSFRVRSQSTVVVAAGKDSSSSDYNLIVPGIPIKLIAGTAISLILAGTNGTGTTSATIQGWLE